MPVASGVGDRFGSGSSKAGRAWCHGASGLRGAAGGFGGVEFEFASSSADGSEPGAVVLWLAEPPDAVRARRGPDEARLAADPGG
ncbi:hypothetical protein ACH3Y9_15910 [Streptomyces sp. WSLK1-5]|uniref:hypothetical protein n=1 Tax=unclassified Streptomyces TaxID=2593676 RepID=UPI000F645F95|nr:hypothetical protein [Streptomyces sp. RP5T]RRR66447.1 hypothetical protein EHS43_44890 [Streptomyces sp. RP5T]